MTEVLPGKLYLSGLAPVSEENLKKCGISVIIRGTKLFVCLFVCLFVHCVYITHVPDVVPPLSLGCNTGFCIFVFLLYNTVRPHLSTHTHTHSG